MKLTQCKMGTFVYRKDKPSIIGIVTGITENSTHEAIPLISWQDGDVYGVHHSNLIAYKD